MHTIFLRILATASLVILAATTLAACAGGVQRPDDCGAPSVERAATLTSDYRLEPNAITVCRDQRVTLEVDVQTDGVLHLHGYDDQTSVIKQFDVAWGKEGWTISPYGYPVHTPNLHRLAGQSLVFRNAFCAAPTCSPSRAALLTGCYPNRIGIHGAGVAEP